MGFAALPALAGATTSESQIQAVIEQHLTHALHDEAQRQGWQNLSFQHDLHLPSHARNLPACPVAPTLSAQPGSLLVERQRFQLLCPGPSGWEVSVGVQVQIFLPVIHADTVIERGQRISAADLTLQATNLSKARRGFYTQEAEVVGLIAKRRIRPQQLITPALLDQPLAVQRGQPVKIIANRDGIAATTMGEALSDGQVGELIRVRNVSSDKVIDAKVVEPGVVSSLF